MEIVVKDQQKKVRLNSPQILKIVRSILRHEDIDQAFLTIVFVSSQKIKALNSKFLKRDYSTDVLAFDLADNLPLKKNHKRKKSEIIGDIIISTDAARKNSRNYGTSLTSELALYVIHGILHLLGFDDHKAGDTNKMRKKEQELLKYLGHTVNKIVK